MTDHVLVINCGSSSLKFAAIDPRTGVAALTGLAERLGSPEASLSARLGEDRHGVTLAGGGHEAAMRAVLDVLDASGLTTRIGAVGHRVVHGGERFKARCASTTPSKPKSTPAPVWRRCTTRPI